MVVRGSPILGSKEDANFNEALKLYDSKQYKKSLKLVEQNLKKNSNHAESLALKGCINYFLNNKTEAEPYVLKGLAKDDSNYIVNHLAGIYYRAVENYPEAAKWFKACMDNGCPNKNILRDLSLLQSQVRDYKNLKDSRQVYLEFQPGYRANWTALAVALHLNKNYSTAVSTLSKIDGIIRQHLQDSDVYEQSECCLYKNDIIFESGEFEKALEDLEKNEDQIHDKLSVMQYRARYFLLLGRKTEASVQYRKLLQRNPDNVSYYRELEISLDIFEKPLSSRLKLYENLAKFYPRADPPKFLPLTFIPSLDPLFKEKAKDYILSQLQRGVPATFVNIKPIMKNKAKRAIIKDLVHEFYKNDSEKENPTVKVWTLYFLSQFYLNVGDITQAQTFIDLAINHSPTLVELYIMKARILKHYGRFEEASLVMNEGCQMDLQDRFINSKASKYYLRANNIDKAIDLISLFTKLDDNSVNGCKDLHTMQANWFLVESAEAYSRIYHEIEDKLAQVDKSNPENEALVNDLTEQIEINKGLALKRFHAIIKIFKIFYNDQFDFHSYCMRRGTPRDYVQTLKWEDELRGTPIYVRVIKGLSKIYLEIHEAQKAEAKLQSDEEQLKVKKTNKKQKKAKAQTMKQKEALIAKVESEKEDKDPLGLKLLHDLENNSQGELIDNLLKLVQPLTVEAKRFQVTWLLSYRLNLIKEKYILSLQAIKNLNGILNPRGTKYLRTIGEMIIELTEVVEHDTATNAAIKMVIQKGLSSAFPDYVSLEKEAFLAKYSDVN